MKNKKPPLFRNLYNRDFTDRELIFLFCIANISLLLYLLIAIYKL